ncbi:MAG: hypothetical protein LBF68_04155, partial [Christensenellaceae bacterium]|nr:hypothetical protein [Christensenellaceae bacterium]
NYVSKNISGRVFGCELTYTSDRIIMGKGLLIIRGYRVSFENEQLIYYDAFPITNEILNLVLRINASTLDSEAVITTEPASNFDEIEKGVGRYDYVLATFVLTPDGIKELTPMIRSINAESNGDIIRIQTANMTEEQLLELIPTLQDDIYIINTLLYGDEFLFVQKNRTQVARYDGRGMSFMLVASEWVKNTDDKEATRWFNGTLITGTGSDIYIYDSALTTECKVGDIYRNNTTQNTYSCIAKDSVKSRWKYESNIRGAEGGVLTDANIALIDSKISTKVQEAAITISSPTNTVGRIVRVNSAHSFVDAVEYHMPCTQTFDSEGIPTSLQFVKDIGIKVTGSQLFDINSYSSCMTGYVVNGNRLTMTTSANVSTPSLKIVGYRDAALGDTYFYLIKPEAPLPLGHCSVKFEFRDSGIEKFNFGMGGTKQDCTASYPNELLVPDTDFTISFDLIKYDVNQVIIENLMFSLGNTEEPYEPYKGISITQPLITESTNLFDKSAVTVGALKEDGTINTSTTSCVVSDFISVDANEYYFIYRPYYTVKFYDENKAPIQTETFDKTYTSTSGGSLLIPNGATYLRFQTYNSSTYKDTAMVNRGTLKRGYEAFGPVTRKGGGINLQNCDRLLKTTNEYEIGSLFLDFSTSDVTITKTSTHEKAPYSIFYYTSNTNSWAPSQIHIANKFFTCVTTSNAFSALNKEGTYPLSSLCYIKVLSSRLGITDSDTDAQKVTKFKDWASSEKLCIVAPLKERIKVKLASPAVDIPSISEGYNTVICYNITKDGSNVPALMDITELQAGEEGRYCVLKNSEDISLFPMTYADTVLMSDGATVEDKLNELQSKLNALLGG